MSIELLKRTPSSYLGSCRYKLPDPDVDSTPFIKLFTLFDKYDICALFYIGGNESITPLQNSPVTVPRWAAASGSSVCPRPSTTTLPDRPHPWLRLCRQYIATILKEVIRDSSVYNIRSVTVAEIMGRHAGWLAGAACLPAAMTAKAPTSSCCPKFPLTRTGS